MAYKCYTLAEIRAIQIGQLREFAKEIGVKSPTTMSKEELDLAVYARLQELESMRKVPSDLMLPTTRAAVLNKMLVTAKDKAVSVPFAPKPLSKLSPFKGIFRTYMSGDGIVSSKIYPQSSDVYVTQAFIDVMLLKSGDIIEGKYAVSPESNQKLLASIDRINGLAPEEARCRDITHYTLLSPSRDMNISSEDTEIKALDLAAAVKYGERIVLTHGGDCSTSEVAFRLAKELQAMGLQVLPLFLGVTPEQAQRAEQSGYHVCRFDLEERYVKAAVGLLADMAQRRAEEGKDTVVIVDGMEMCSDADLTRLLLGSACELGGSSITVFVCVNENVMERREYSILTACADAVVCFERANCSAAVNFAKCRLRSDKADRPVLDCLKEMSGTAARRIISGCGSRAEAEKILG